MNSAEIFNSTKIKGITGSPPPEIKGITQDSRKVEEGFLFVAIPGSQLDGASFIPHALEKGAYGVVVEKDLDVTAPFVIKVESPRAALADLSSAFYGRPSEKLKVVGVTGTDGKTTTTHLIRHLLLEAGWQVGVLNTVYLGWNKSEEKSPFSNTTPGSTEVQSFLADVVSRAILEPPKAAVLEVSSHAIALDRVRAVEFDAAVFTNLTPEHLEFHHTFEEYREAKTQLFAQLGHGVKNTPKFGVINADDLNAGYFRSACSVPIIDYGMASDCRVRGEIVSISPSGTEFKFIVDDEEYQTFTKLPGRFNISNWLAGLSVAHGFGLDLDSLVSKIPYIESVKGRMMEIQEGQPFRVIVDFAHTPGALRTVVNNIKEQNPNRLAVIIGHAGGRDPNNRPELARAAEGGDFIFLTMDDPCDEDPIEIAKIMADALRADGKRESLDLRVVVDRKEAIREALFWAKPQDLVLIAGRGHESYLPIGDINLPFDDVLVAKELLTGMGYSN